MAFCCICRWLVVQSCASRGNQCSGEALAVVGNWMLNSRKMLYLCRCENCADVHIAIQGFHGY